MMSLFFSAYIDDYGKKKHNIEDLSSFIKNDLIFTRCYPPKNVFGQKVNPHLILDFQDEENIPFHY